MNTIFKPMDVLAELKKQGIRVWTEKGELKYQAPRGAMTPGLLEQLKAGKAELIAFLEKMAAPVSGDSLPGELPSGSGDIPRQFAQMIPAAWNPDAFPRQNTLDIIVQRELTTYLHCSLPYCVILNDKRYLPWYYTHFMRIYSYENEEGLTEVRYLELYDGYQEIIHLITMGFPLFNGDTPIIPYIIEKINLGYYLIINVDEYYLAAKQSYQQHHFVHASLIYGYDWDKQELLGVGFNQYRLFDKLRFSFQEFHKAWEAARYHYQESAWWCGWSALQLLKPGRNPAEYPFDMDRFMDELAGYLFSKPDVGYVYIFCHPEDKVHYGFDVYDVVAARLMDLLEGKLCIDYRAIHLLAEHKQGICTRLEYAGARYNLGDTFAGFLEDYRGIAEHYNKMRIELMKAIIEPLSLNQQFIITASLKEIIKNLREEVLLLKNREYALLTEIYNLLEQKFPSRQTRR